MRISYRVAVPVGLALAGASLFALETWVLSPSDASETTLSEPPLEEPPPTRKPPPSSPKRPSALPSTLRRALRAKLLADNHEHHEEAFRAKIAEWVREADGIEDRLSAFLAATAEIRTTAEQKAQDPRNALTEWFLRMEPVQEDLRAMEPTERADALSEIRRRMGFTPEYVERLRALDRHRDARWSNGLNYMQAREDLVHTLKGEALEKALSTLRTEYFGPRADTIRKEEDDGFFRFRRQRIYGRN